MVPPDSTPPARPLAPGVRVPAPAAFSSDELLRYSRHLLLPEVGLAGQQRLKAARVLLVGAGGLGSPAALYLAAAGVGTLGLVEFDTVDLSNLQRQILHGTSQLGEPKVSSADARLRDLNPEITVVPIAERLTSANALGIVAGYDVVIDGSDNFPTRYLVNDACVLSGKPLVYGSVVRFDGQVSVFDATRGPCYRCLFSEPPPAGLVPSCAEGGVLGVLPGIIGTLQALEAIKLVLGIGEPLVGRLVLFDALRLQFRELALRKDPDCPLCGAHPSITALIDYEAFCGVGSATPRETEVSVAELAREVQDGRPIALLDVREPVEWEIVHLDGATLMPLATLPSRASELDPRAELVVYCHHGARSLQAVDFLRAAGFSHARSLAGGIAAWAEEIDPAMNRY
ncbi:MAG: molybdopterin-synthase adenylyltransferase MoeB [Gemmatimonadales bacterium]